MSEEGKTSRFEQKIRHSTQKLAIWTCIWLISSALVAFGPKFLWNESVAITWVAVVINVLCGIAVVIANKNHFRDLDDLHRKVMFDAMAITLGVGLVVSVPWTLLNIRDEIEHLLVVMSITFVCAVFFGMRRYR